ncbi:hypothetical protein ASPBRDRAFT_183030 [Aspergillus brasiliensis CBS 101740]|uniref:MYND-type domain-containing protein n=1 Tax=Aspergillus brasiliensis (strain CBS 101740 / IMI 381727 / IBT 21946) TaxID=767769 RepID=A0A1L9UAW8_ASPBC|nr:hypothetical protein ASPBRDRAFT_183030 [Aspergillus brasiliensis CBS 101740]
MSSSPSGPCANCGKHTTLQCGACRGAPEYFPGDTTSIFYCGATCQRAHRTVHKPDCMNMARRKKLLRTAIIAKEAFLVYRAAEYDVELSKIEKRGDTLYLYDNQKNLDIPYRRGPFPEHLTADPEHRAAALTWFQCNAAPALTSRLVRKILKGVPCDIVTFGLQVGKPRFTTQVIPGPDSPNIPSLDSATTPHVVLKVDLRLSFGTESWILDLTGAQYGFQDVLVPFLKYTHDKECDVVSGAESFEITETSDLDSLIKKFTGVRRAIVCAERPARLRFAAFVDRIDKKILDGSIDIFENKLGAFRLALKQHMSSGSQCA